MKYSYYNMDGLEVLMLCDRRQKQWSHLYEGLPWWLSYKESACNPGAAGDLGSIPGLGRSPGEGNGNPLPDFCLEKPRDRGAWRAIVCVSQSQTTEQLTLSLSLWASLVAQLVKNPPAMRETWAWSLGGEDPLEKGPTTHSSILAWRIPWTEEPGGLQSVGLRRVEHKWESFIFPFLGLPGSLEGKESACSAGNPSLIPGSERPPRVGNGNPIQYSCLGIP